MKLMISTNPRVGQKMLNGEFSDIVWASDNLETVAHYYEGCVIEIDIVLNKDIEMEYVRSIEGVKEINIALSNYTYGSAEMNCPKDAVWYSFSRKYMKNNVKNIKEINPDLQYWNE